MNTKNNSVGEPSSPTKTPDESLAGSRGALLPIINLGLASFIFSFFLFSNFTQIAINCLSVFSISILFYFRPSLFFRLECFWLSVFLAWLVKTNFYLTMLAVRIYDSIPPEGDVGCFQTYMLIRVLVFREFLSRREIQLRLVMAGIESNPGPHVCKKCGETVTGNMISHMKEKHPILVDCKHCGKTMDLADLKKHLISEHPRKKKEESAKVVEVQVQKEVQQDLGVADAAQEVVQEHIDKHEDVKAQKAIAPEVLVQSEIDLIELEEKLSVVKIKYTTPNSGLPSTGLPNGPNIGVSELFSRAEYFCEAKMHNLLHIGELPIDYVSNQAIHYGLLTEFVWLACYVGWVWLIEGIVVRVFNALSAYVAKEFVTGFFKVATDLYLFYCAACYLFFLLMSVFFCKRTARGNVKLPLCFIVSVTLIELHIFYQRILVYLGVLRPHRAVLVGRPTGAVSRDTRDRRPELDRGEHFANTDRQQYQLLVIVKDPLGCRAYDTWPGLHPQWYDNPRMFFADQRLTTVELDNGLMSTALSRLTMLKSKKEPALALESCLRQITANSAYQEDYHRLYGTGRSVYRDMALVCGAIVAKDISYENSAF